MIIMMRMMMIKVIFFIGLRLPIPKQRARRLTSAMACAALPILSFPISVQAFVDGLKRSTCKQKQDISSHQSRSPLQYLISGIIHIIQSTNHNHLLVQVSSSRTNQRPEKNLLCIGQHQEHLLKLYQGAFANDHSAWARSAGSQIAESAEVDSAPGKSIFLPLFWFFSGN